MLHTDHVSGKATTPGRTVKGPPKDGDRIEVSMPAKAVVQGSNRRKYWYDSRILVGGRLVAPLPEQYHGKKSTYDYYGCRCDLCSKAASKRTRKKPNPDDSAEDAPPKPAVVAPTFLEPVAMPTPRQPETEPEPEPEAEGPPPERRLGAVPDLGAEVPEITPGARAEITSVDHLKAVLEAYHNPQWTAAVPNNPALEKRSAGGVLLKVGRNTGVVVFVGTSDQSSDAPECLRERTAPRSTKRGGSGSGMPTSYDELADRLVDLGCTVDRSGGRHVTVTLPSGKRRSLPRKAGDWRGVRNAVAQFKADGLDLRRDRS